MDKLSQSLSHAMTKQVESGAVPGLVAVISRLGQIDVEVAGAKSVGGPAMTRDTIFRITSMTKPISAVATMMLIEAGRLGLDDPVDRWLPELADRQVLRRLDGPLDDVEAAKRPITIRDLLTLRMGFGLIMAQSSDYPIQQAIDGLGLSLGPPKPRTLLGPDEWIAKLGSLPLMAHPGEAWMYDTGLQVLGVLLARVAGQPLESLLQELVLDPLGMKDTGFTVPASELHRLADCYMVDPATGGLRPYDEARDSQWSRPPAFPHAAGGLVSTADDYLAFGTMMLNGGTHDGQRLLSDASVALMATDQLSPSQRNQAAMFLDGAGWGLGMSTPTDNARGPQGFGWDGGFGTSWRSNPATGTVAILMTQRMQSMEPCPVHAAFWSLAAYLAK